MRTLLGRSVGGVSAGADEMTTAGGEDDACAGALLEPLKGRSMTTCGGGIREERVCGRGDGADDEHAEDVFHGCIHVR
jgi:hypothetical protein